MNSPLYFIHIPKTAGTSFRGALSQTVGDSNVYCDYGKNAKETNELVHRYIYQQYDPYQLFSVFNEQEGEQKVLAGHAHFNQYRTIFSPDQVISFVRQPLARLLSEFKHFVRHKNYSEPLRTFISTRRFINLQSRYLAGAPLSSFGFIGLTEEYPSGLEIIESSFSLALSNLQLNKAPEGRESEFSVSDEDISLFHDLNAADCEMYHFLERIYLTRKLCADAGIEFTHGEFRVDNEGMVRGFAYRAGSTFPIDLLVMVDGEIVSEASASEYSAQLASLGLPRLGHIAFSVLTQVAKERSAEVDVVVRDTGQTLVRSFSPDGRVSN